MQARVASHYDTLGVPRDASPAAIRAAWRALARQWHPDFHQGDRTAEQRMQAINVAFDVLSCPLRRREYDRWLDGAGPATPRPAAASRGRPMTPAERREAWARARAAREARMRWESARPRVRRSTVSPDSFGPVLTAVTAAVVAMALFWHALPGPRPQPRLLAEALGLEEPRRTALASYAPLAPPSTEPRVRVVVSPPPSRAAAGPVAPGPSAGSATLPATPAEREDRRATLAELVEAARRGEAAAQAWRPRLPVPDNVADTGPLPPASLGALGQAAQAAAAARAAALAEQEMRRLMVSDAQMRVELAQRMAALDAELEAAAAVRRAAQAARAGGAAPERAEPPVPGPEVSAGAGPGAQP